MRSSQAAFDDIVREEVSSEAVYRKKYQRPEWPGAMSGVTVGIGYDLGQTDRATIRADWSGRVTANMLDIMVACSGKTGTAGRDATSQVRHLIDIPWETAIAVHKESVIPRWEARVAAALPNTEKLSGDCFGALLSLTFNRGPSFDRDGDRYREMRAIKIHMAAGNFAAIPGELRGMKRLWPDIKGLRDRRDREAALFERGLMAPPKMRPVAEAKPLPKAADQKAETGTAGGIVLTGAAAAATAAKQGLKPSAIIAIVVAALVAAVIAFVVIKKIKKG